MLLQFTFMIFISLGSALYLYPKWITYLKAKAIGQSVSEYALADDQKKTGTPIMGGVIFILVPIVATLIVQFRHISTELILIMFVYVAYGCIGYLDDYIITIQKNNAGLRPRYKFGLQILVAVIVFYLYSLTNQLVLHIPLTQINIPLHFSYFVLILLMFSGSSNAVNLTDGMDGLAAGVSLIGFIAYILIAIHQQHYALALFLTGVCSALVGYLCFNMKPAKIFMGDTGSLALGGLFAICAMVTKTELGLILIAGVPVIETVCVIIQQVSVRTVHKKVFIYTPIHYAFRLKGMPEKSIVYLFWIMEAIFAMIGFWICIQ